MRALDEFVRRGGTMIAINSSALCASGSILEVVIDVAHPVMAGMPDRAKVFFDRSPAFATTEGFQGAALASYESAGSPLLLGYLLGEKYLQVAALDAKHERGHVVRIGFRPQWRGQTVGALRVLFNAALYGREVAERAKPTGGFWTTPKPASDSVRR